MAEREKPTQTDIAAMTEALAAALETEAEAGALPLQPIPIMLGVSGLYRWTQSLPIPPIPQPIPKPIPLPIPGMQQLAGGEAGAETAEQAEAAAEAEMEDEAMALPILVQREELRLDVDGRYPQMAASGTVYRFGLKQQMHWIARLRRVAPNTWSGPIWYKDGATATFPYTRVKISATPSFFPNQRKATAVFTGGGALQRTRTYSFLSAYFRPVELEYDCESSVQPVLEIQTHAHPNRPAGLPSERLVIDTVFKRAGFNTTRTGAASAIPTDGPDPNTTWSDAEMHDAMQVYWSRFANKAQWSLWTLFARQHDMGSGLGGIMFDDIGPNHRQGTAIFYDSFISDAPSGDPAPQAWIDRERFWTAVHEMGHAFNLAHSWQKHLGTPWIPLAPEPEARSFMNYPDNVNGGQQSFFADFEFRFSDSELLFMRHAPERFVQMGNADWFDHHGFQNGAAELENGLILELGIDRQVPALEFLEPVVLSLTLTNISNRPRVVPSDVLKDTGHMTVILKRNGAPARQWAPYAAYCCESTDIVLKPGESLTESLFVSAGLNGWDLAQPGQYLVQMALDLQGRPLVSNRLALRVAPPKGYDEEYLAQDVCTEEAGRVMAFDGSMMLESGLNAWREVVAKLPASRAAVHARICLALPKTRTYRLLKVDAPQGAIALDGRGAFALTKPKLEESRSDLNQALIGDASAAAATLGRVDYDYYCRGYAEFLKGAGAETEAKKVDDMRRKVAAAMAPKVKPTKAAAE